MTKTHPQTTDSDGSVTDRFPPQVLRQYSVLADGERGVLVGPRGDFSWMCAPRWHDEAVFSSLIGGEGLYAITPHRTRFVWGGFYEPDSLIWRSRWITTSGIIECREALAFPGERHRAVILRRVIAVDGDASVFVTLDARAAFGRHRMSDDSVNSGVWEARSGPLRLRWTGIASELTRTRSGAAEMQLGLTEGDSHDLVLEISDQSLPDEHPVADQAWTATERAWDEAVPSLGATIADREARHSYAVLRGLTSSDGGMVAAATMSLPERADARRNYDYRYAWIRDQCYAGQAVAVVGGSELLENAVAFLSNRIRQDGPKLKPAYLVDGGPVPDETSLDLPGYPGGDATIGNHVNQQFQLDSFGEALLLFAAAERAGCLGQEHEPAIDATVTAIVSRLEDADAGIWELHDERWTHSRLICAAGLRAIAKVAPAARGAPWLRLADQIVADAARDCLHPSGRWQRSPSDERVDAALLLPALRGAVPASDTRSRATLAAVSDELAEDGYVYRFRHDQRPLGEAEGAFLLCGFLMAMGCQQQGQEVEAMAWFQRNMAGCGPPALFTEEFDVRQHQLRGNLPQAFVHALMLESARRLAEPWPRS